MPALKEDQEQSKERRKVMKKLEHKGNSNWWSKKVGEANAEQVAEFAKQYQRGDGATAWCVTVTEGKDWISAGHIRDVMAVPQIDASLVVWISDGRFAQCVWRREVAGSDRSEDCGQFFDKTAIESLERIAKNIHYPECWDTMAYPTVADAVCDITHCDLKQCSHKTKDAVDGGNQKHKSFIEDTL